MKTGRQPSYFQRTKKYFTIMLMSLLSIMIVSDRHLFAAETDTNQFEVDNLQGEASVQLGALGYVVPMNAPPGIHGLKPDLAVAYRQGGKNEILGMGFALSGFSFIYRCPASGKVDGFNGGVGFNDNDRYCLDGQRLIAIKGKDGADGTEYRLRHNTSIKVTSHGQTGGGPSWWKVWSADGYIMEYGRENNSLETLSGNGLSWHVSSRQDRFGNKLSYHYKIEKSFVYPERIEYSGYQIVFIYEPKPDAQTVYRRGQTATLEKRLKEVEIHSPGGLLRKYIMNYDDLNVGNVERRYSRLNSIQVCSGSGKCPAPLKFKYKTNPALRDSSDDSAIFSKTLFELSEFQNYLAGDLDKDGLNDFCYYNGGLYCAKNLGNYEFSPVVKWTEVLDSDHWNDTKRQQTMSLVDINRDGRLDYCLFDETGLFCGLNSQGEKFSNDRYWTQEVNMDEGARLIDIDKNGLPDVCSFKNDGVWCALNDGEKMGAIFKLKGENMTWDFENRIIYSLDYDAPEHDYLVKIPQPQLLDINGDGYIDACGFKEDENYHCALGKADASGDVPSFHAPIKWAGNFPMGDNKRLPYPHDDPRYETEYPPYWKETTPSYWKLKTEQFNRTFRYADLNSDGLADICYRRDSNYICRLNNGGKFMEEQVWQELPGDWIYDDEYAIYEGRIHPKDNVVAAAEVGISLNDRDGDGVADFCTINGEDLKCAWNFNGRFNDYGSRMTFMGKMKVAENSQTYYENGVRKLFGWGETVDYMISYSILGPYKQIPDLDEDMRPDECYRGSKGIICAFSAYDPLALLETVEDSYGNKTVIEYGLMSDPLVYTPEEDEAPLIGLTPRMYPVKALKTSDGAGNFNRLMFHYKGYRVHPEDGPAGFRIIEKTNETSRTSTATEYALEEPLLGKALKTIDKADGKLVKESSWQYECLEGIHSQVKPVVLKSATALSYDLNGNQLSKRETVYSEHTAYGTPKRVEASVSGGGKVFSNITVSSYLNNDSNWLISKPLNVSVTHSAPETSPITRTTAFDYYPDTGALRHEILEPDHELSLTSTFTYDSAGNRTKTIVSDSHGKQRISEIVPDELGRPVERTNSLGHKETISYHPLCGLPDSRTDPNGLTATWEYDSFCRKTKTIAPDNQTVEWFYQWSDGADIGVDYQNLGLTGGDRSVYMVIQRSSGGLWSKAYYDSLEREVRSVKLGSSGKKIIQDKLYDSLGRLGAVSLPYFEGEFPGDNASWLRTGYDVLGRPAETKKPGKDNPAVINYSYQGLAAIEEGPVNYKKITTKNINGQVVSIKENDSLITYKYNALGNLIETNTDGYIVKIHYDLMGNKDWMEDQATGKIDYEYNAFGELVRQKDAKGQEIILDYDPLGRLIARQEAEGVSTWEYDNSSDAIGKLISANGIQASRRYAYDQYGRVSAILLATDNRLFSTSHEYDRDGRLKKTIHPDGLELNRYYAVNGDLQKIGVPKKNIWDYDYLQLEEALRKIGERILELGEQAAAHEQKASEYITQSSEFRYWADYYADKSDALKEDAQALREHADTLEKQSLASMEQALYYRERANLYWDKYKNWYFSYQGMTSKGYHYKATICTKWSKRKRKGGATIKCTRKKKATEYVSPELMKIYSSSGPPNKLNLSDFYTKIGDYHHRQSEEKQEEADLNKEQANEYMTQAQEYQNTSDEMFDKAEEYARLAREQTDMLREATEELEEQQAAQEALETAMAERSQDDTQVYLWTAVSRDAAGRIKGELFGNGLLTRREFDPYTGHLKRISTGMGTDLIRDLNYSYDQRDNVRSRNDAISGVSETFLYDAYERLTDWNYDDPSGDTLSRIYTYDARSNMKAKTGAGTMFYDQANRLTSRIDESGTEHSYSYDANGNQLQGDGRTFVWTSFNKVKSVASGAGTTEFSYGPDRERVFKKSSRQNVYYVSPEYELVEETDGEGLSTVKMRHHIFVDGQAVVTYEKSLIDGETQADKAAYLHRDALGSVDTVTNNQGERVLKNRFTPFGERLDLEQPETELFQAEELRGYTGHEHVAEAGLINMNARLYDPLTARFLSPDTLIPAPDHWQSYNRYAYVYNNPMKYTDPEGHWAVFAIGLYIYVASQLDEDPNVRKYGGMVGVAMMGAGGVVPGAGVGAVMANGAIVSFTVGYLNSGGDLNYAATQGFIGGVSAGATYGIGHESGLHWAAQAGMHGTVQGIVAEARGGRFQDGFIAAVISKTGGHYSAKYLGQPGDGNQMKIAIRTAAAATLGGLASQATGGSFEDGAWAAAFVHLYNDEWGWFSMNDEQEIWKNFVKGIKWLWQDETEPIVQGAQATSDFGRNYIDMRIANNLEQDHYFHCKTNCQAAKRGIFGYNTAEKLSNFREWLDYNIKNDTLQACMADQKANLYGRNNFIKGPCVNVCQPYRPNGLPDKY